jgi:hypothetical protein
MVSSISSIEKNTCNMIKFMIVLQQIKFALENSTQVMQQTPFVHNKSKHIEYLSK